MRKKKCLGGKSVFVSGTARTSELRRPNSGKLEILHGRKSAKSEILGIFCRSTVGGFLSKNPELVEAFLDPGTDVRYDEYEWTTNRREQ